MKISQWGPALLGILVLAVSGALMGGLLTFKREPAEAIASQDEKPVHVEVQTVQPLDVPVHISGYGQVKALRTLSIVSEVSGRIVSVHPALVAGGRIGEGEVLFEIDPRPYAAHVADAEAQIQRQESALLRLKTEQEHAAADLKDLARKAELAANAHARARTLHEQGIGSQASVDESEQALVSARNAHDQLERDLALYPIRIGEAQSDLLSAGARLKLAQVDLEHTKVTAPFPARVKEEQVELGAIVGAGSAMAVLADDSVLEIAVPLNSRDARKWLKFEARGDTPADAWFGDLAPVPCTIRWTEGEAGQYWEGTLDRVERYDESSRTLTVVVRIAGMQRQSPADHFPLVEGMFCSVRIPGRDMKGVFRLPPHAVSFEDTVLVADGDRLKTVPVSVARIEEDFTYVAGGLSAGDRVVTTRLVNPLDRTLLSVTEAGAEPAG